MKYISSVFILGIMCMISSCTTPASNDTKTPSSSPQETVNHTATLTGNVMNEKINTSVSMPVTDGQPGDSISGSWTPNFEQ